MLSGRKKIEAGGSSFNIEYGNFFSDVKNLFHPGDFDLRLFLRVSVPVTHVAAVLQLAWPSFVEYRGGIFLSFVFDRDGIDRWFAQDGSTVSSVERMCNHVHLWDVVTPESSEGQRALSLVGLELRKIWDAALRAAYPKRRFEVVFFADEPEDYGPTLSFAQVDV